MKVFLNLVLILLSFFACYVEDLYLLLLPPQPGKVIPITVRSQQSFNFDQEKALGGKRERAISQYIPLYTYIPDRDAEAKKELETLTEKISTLRLQKTTGTQELLGYVRSKYGLEFPQAVASTLLRYKDLKNLMDGILTIEESILQSKIVEDPQPLKGKKTIEVLYPKPSGIVAFPADEVITLEQARLTMQEKVRQLFWQVDKSVLDPIVELTLSTLRPNLKYDLAENHRRIEEIISMYPSKVIPYNTGQILVPSRKMLTEKDVLLLSAYREEAEKDLYGKAFWILVAILFTVAFYGLFLQRLLRDDWRKDPPYRLLLSLLIITVFLLKACLLFTPFPIFVLPFAVLPLLIVLLNSDKVSATWTTVAAAVLVSLFSGRNLNVLLFFAFGGIAALTFSLGIRKRIHILLPSLAVAATNAFIFLAFSLDWGAVVSPISGLQITGVPSFSKIFNSQMLRGAGWAFMGGLAAGPLAIILLPLLEMSLQTASTFKLNRYANLEHPLLKDLLTKTPATYQHTMTVAYLAQAVGEAIGANTLLLRIGAYYHDIGKMTDPKFFAENQPGGKNPHDDLDPHESARIIIGHVINGEKLGRGMKLPEEVMNFIPQHHGTQLVEYFYSKAIKNKQGNGVRKEDFQYPGPKPQSVEAAILMISDAVEAASRSLEAPTREKIEKMVRLLIVKRIADGQFDECHLSTRYLARIIRTLVDSLEASFHSRVVYPWQEREAERAKARAERKA